MFPFKENQPLSRSRSNGSHTAGRAVMLFAAAALIGFLGWSGVARLSWISLLYPFLYLQSRSRLEAFSAVFYYAGATWSVIPGSAVFFGTNASFAASVASLPRLHCARQSSLGSAVSPPVH